MLRTQARIGRWMVAASLVTTAAASAVPTVADDWLSDDGAARAVVSDGGVDLVDPPLPEGAIDDGPGVPASTSTPSPFTAASAPVSEGIVADDGGAWGMGEMTGWVADACRYPRDSGPFQQPGLLQVLHDRKCAT